MNAEAKLPNKAMLHRCYAAGLAIARRKLQRYVSNKGPGVMYDY